MNQLIISQVPKRSSIAQPPPLLLCIKDKDDTMGELKFDICRFL